MKSFYLGVIVGIVVLGAANMADRYMSPSIATPVAQERLADPQFTSEYYKAVIIRDILDHKTHEKVGVVVYNGTNHIPLVSQFQNNLNTFSPGDVVMVSKGQWDTIPPSIRVVARDSWFK